MKTNKQKAKKIRRVWKIKPKSRVRESTKKQKLEQVRKREGRQTS